MESRSREKEKDEKVVNSKNSFLTFRQDSIKLTHVNQVDKHFVYCLFILLNFVYLLDRHTVSYVYMLLFHPI